MADLPSLLLPPDRQRYITEQKAAIVKQSMAPDVSIASVVMAHGINANQLHKWRYLYKQGQLGPIGDSSIGSVLSAFLPVRVASAAPASGQVSRHKKGGRNLGSASAVSQTGYVELHINGHCARVHGHVPTESLRAIVMALKSAISP
jgi:transposase